jgi:hypothetical protein
MNTNWLVLMRQARHRRLALSVNQELRILADATLFTLGILVIGGRRVGMVSAVDQSRVVEG